MTFRFLILLGMVLGGLSACKARQGNSALQDEGDIQPGQMQWVESESRWAITCREGRLHNGNRSALVSSRELRSVCEEDDPEYGNGSGTGGGTGGGTGTGGGGNRVDWSVEEQCQGVPEPARGINFAVAPELGRQLSEMQRAVARQTLCVGFIGRFTQILVGSETLQRTIQGTDTGSPILVMITVEPPADSDQPRVQFDSGSYLLTMSVRITEQTLDQLGAAFEASDINICGDGFRRVIGACWALATSSSEDCNAVCEGSGKQYSAKTATKAGWPGGEEGCRAVGEAFGVSYVGQTPYCSSTIGCLSWNNRETNLCNQGGQATGATSAPGTIWNARGQQQGSAYRFCACK